MIGNSKLSHIERWLLVHRSRRPLDATASGGHPDLFMVEALVILLPLLFGTAIYLLYRNTHILLFDLVSAIGARPAVDVMRSFFRSTLPVTNKFVLYSVPTGLWAFSFLYFVLTIWSNTKNVLRYVSLVGVIVIVEGSEIGQLSIIPGTFDVNDLLCDTAGLASAWCVSCIRHNALRQARYRKSLTGACFGIFLLLAGASGESDTDAASRLKSEYGLSQAEYADGLKTFESSSKLEEALRLAKSRGISLGEIAKGSPEYGSLPDYKAALEKNMTVTQYNSYKAQILSCSRDWQKCTDNEQLVNNFSGWAAVQYACKTASNDLAKFGDPEWPWFPFGTFLTGTRYVTTGIAIAIEKDARFENGFGAKARSEVVCTYDLRSKKVVNVQISPK